MVIGAKRRRNSFGDPRCSATRNVAKSEMNFLRRVVDWVRSRASVVYGDGNPHIAEAIPMMRGFSPTQRMSIGHHADVGQAVARLLDAPSPVHRIYNVVDDEAPDLATLFASVGAPPPDGSNAAAARPFDALLDGRRIREDLGFRPRFPRLGYAMAAGA